MAAKRWVTVCLHDAALHLTEADLRAELARWVPGRSFFLPGCERGKLSAAHPYALFAFIPDTYAAQARAMRRSRLVEQVLLDPIPDKELQRSLRRVGGAKVGDLVKVIDGPLSGVEGAVVRALRHGLQLRVSLRSGDRKVWVRRWEVESQ